MSVCNCKIGEVYLNGKKLSKREVWDHIHQYMNRNRDRSQYEQEILSRYIKAHSRNLVSKVNKVLTKIKI